MNDKRAAKPRGKSARAKPGRKASKAVPKKKAAKKAGRGKVAGKTAKRRLPSGYRKNRGGRLLVPDEWQSIDTVVEPSKLVSGIRAAKSEVQGVIDELANFGDGFDVSEVTLEVSFSADGKFLGVGVGGATSLGLKLTPSDETE